MVPINLKDGPSCVVVENLDNDFVNDISNWVSPNVGGENDLDSILSHLPGSIDNCNDLCLLPNTDTCDIKFSANVCYPSCSHNSDIYFIASQTRHSPIKPEVFEIWLKGYDFVEKANCESRFERCLLSHWHLLSGLQIFRFFVVRQFLFW